ncbi:MAG: hypothetical protein LBU47_01020 [Christensenellaceae bacterium]|jgi:hypothetical protein|nr:hypothetical protein [Christensenellaceae bacterium]
MKKLLVLFLALCLGLSLMACASSPAAPSTLPAASPEGTEAAAGTDAPTDSAAPEVPEIDMSSAKAVVEGDTVTQTIAMSTATGASAAIKSVYHFTGDTIDGVTMEISGPAGSGLDAVATGYEATGFTVAESSDTKIVLQASDAYVAALAAAPMTKETFAAQLNAAVGITE